VEAARIPWRPLGRLLVEQGLLTEDELERALEHQATTGRRLGETLVDLELVSHPALSRALAEQYGIELKSETGFGTGLRAEIERRHDQGRDSEIAPVPQSSETAPALSLVPELEAPEPDELDSENVLLAQLEEQWAKLAAAEERLLESERDELEQVNELAALRWEVRHRRDQAVRLVERVRMRDRQIAELSASERDEGKELTALRQAVEHRRDHAIRLLERLRTRDRHIAELSADGLAQVNELKVLRREVSHRRDQAVRLVERVRTRDRRIAELAASERDEFAQVDELTALRWEVRHRRDQAVRLVERIRMRDRQIAELSPQVSELTALRRAVWHRRAQTVRLVERIRKRDRRIGELSSEPKPVEPDASIPSGHLIYAQLPGRYVLVERDGAPPEPDALLELPEIGDETVLVDRVGRSPLPNDARPCAFAQQLLSPSED
jgi:hypothetical protein